MQMIPIGQLSMKKLAIVGQASGKLWRWKRSHHQWLVQFKWKWQKPWRLSEWIRHSDETIMRARPRSQALPRIMWIWMLLWSSICFDSVHFLTYKNDPRNKAIKNQKLGAGNNPCPIQPFKNYILTYPTFDTNIYDFVITIQKISISFIGE